MPYLHVAVWDRFRDTFSSAEVYCGRAVYAGKAGLGLDKYVCQGHEGSRAEVEAGRAPGGSDGLSKKPVTDVEGAVLETPGRTAGRGDRWFGGH